MAPGLRADISSGEISFPSSRRLFMDKKMPSSLLNHLPHLPLSDEDLAWIGAVTAYWAFGEQQIEMLICTFARSDLSVGQCFVEKRVISFDQKIRNAKKIIRLTLHKSPLAQEIGVALMIKGKQLSEKRKRFGHWIAQNRAPIHEGMSFVDFANVLYGQESSMPKTETLSYEEIKDLTRDISEWSFEVGRFPIMCLLNRLLSTQVTIHGPEPSHMALRWEDFHTIQKIPRSQTSA